MSSFIIKRRWGVKKDAYDVLANPITSASLDDKQYAGAISLFLHREKENLFKERFSNLYKKPRFSQSFNSSAKCIEEFAVKDVFGVSVPLPRIAFTYKHALLTRKNEIFEFCRLRRQYERCILKGDLDGANSTLELCKSILGESLWYIRCKFSILISKGKFDDLEEFSKKCKDRSNSELISLILRYSLLLESNPNLHFERIVMRTIRTLDEANLPDWAAVLRLLFCPKPLTCFPNTLYGLRSLQTFSLIDQFHLLEKFVSESIATHGAEGDPFNFSEFFKPDADFASNLDLNNSTLALRELTSLYEQGDYHLLIEFFKRNFDIIEEPFTTLNIVAKAIAIAPHIEIPFAKGAINQIINALVSIYKLDASATTLEENFASLAIKFHHFKGGHCLQLAIYKALPHRYDHAHTTWIARAANEFSTGTPLSLALSTGADPIMEYSYINEEYSLAIERRIKSDIRAAWSNESLNEIPDLLASYKIAATLKKDFVEVASCYYLKTNNFHELLDFSANTLASNPRFLVALPIEKIVEFLVASRISSLQSIIVFDAYVKYVDEQKEFLLHEAYEEFLVSSGVDRPTELLTCETGELSPLQQVFFRDISNVETMDYLGCFNNSNELRSERVQILDELRNRRLISPEAHGEEVDEIIGQVVVDAGAAEFNTNKIEVNTAALKRNLLADVNSMLLLYRSLGTEAISSKKAISVGNDDDGEDGEKLQALVAGDRNTALLRLLVLISDAFLSDEKLGLDKNLSTEIRHGFFANLMRSRLEDQKLITEIDENGKYKKNQYWRDANAILVDETLDEIDAHLVHFSMGMNGLIEKAEEWMKISRAPNVDRVFVFEIYLNQLEAYHPIAVAYEADEFIDVCFNNLWHQVEARLTEIREKLNVNFKDSVNRLFDELLANIEITRKNFPMTDLIGAIFQVKSGIREDITAVSEWFKRSETTTAVPKTVEDLIRISLECFYRVRGVHLNCIIDMPIEMQKIKVAGQHSKAFIVVFVNLLENACRGSGLGVETPISVSGSENGRSWSLSIMNLICSERINLYSEEYLVQLDSIMRSPSSIPLMRREGGSGLAKVFNQLRLIDENFDVRLNLTEVPSVKFEVRIIYET